MEPYEEKMRRGGAAAIEEACRFFSKDDPVHHALQKITERLNALKIPYAIAGGMALVAHGYEQTTVDLDILVTKDGLTEIHKHLDGQGYVLSAAGSKSLRDTETGVRIKFMITGDFPGDCKPKPVVFPDPESDAIEVTGIKYIGLTSLLDLKLSSGMTNPGRLKDIGDVIALIQELKLSSDFSSKLNPYVREKYLELWRGIQEDTSPTQ